MNTDVIVEYNMPDLQAKAYKIGLSWITLAQKYFPDIRHAKYPKRGDPRNSNLFRYCYKLARDTNGLIEDSQYNLFITAQLQILKSIDLGEGLHPRIEPSCLTSNKAWIRWKIWLKKYEQISKRQTKKDVGLNVTPCHIITKGLESTKKFFFGKFNGEPREEQIRMAINDIERWVNLTKVSPYYCVLSPWVKRYSKVPIVDENLYNESITEEISNIFKKIFSYEF